MNPQTIKLRVYPNKAQEQELFLSFKARQFAYHMGIDLYAKDSREFFRLKPSEEFLAAELVKSPQAIRLPYKPKRRSSAFLSQQLTVLLNEIRRYEKRADDLTTAFGSAVESHPQVWLLAVPRCVFSQGFIDYQKALSEAFASLKSGKSSKSGKAASEKSGKSSTKKSSSGLKRLPEKFTRKDSSSAPSSESFSLVRRFPTFYSLYDQQTARFQIDKPATNYVGYFASPQTWVSPCAPMACVHRYQIFDKKLFQNLIP